MNSGCHVLSENIWFVSFLNVVMWGKVGFWVGLVALVGQGEWSVGQSIVGVMSYPTESRIHKIE